MFISARAYRLGAILFFSVSSMAWSAPQVTLSMPTTSGDSILSAGEDIIWYVNHMFKSGPSPCGCYVRVI